ncbi:hypothetical protein J4050_13000 [Winogradskyella sp. DF17]|uniref:Outer membrane protein beta-barrel domain-containing protein n=1 Tax=Winogradskyella pelagia TaxID=2819984 RepID=A0ABS3T4J7_9FLAO|nr:hypothetical protein [Winogradskyella sp. DF17]MBO3117668.1 hypothetical protein [Winogradskyella sp. DF17]
MRLILSVFVLLTSLATTSIVSQELTNKTSKESFIEWNFGVAYLPEGNSLGDISIFPGTSVLWGTTSINENGFIFEYSAGFALPSIITGKLGIGQKFGNTKVIFGIRPFPSNLYLSSSFTNGDKGYWIVSVEYNPLDSNLGTSFESQALFTLGYRWYITKRN